MIEQVLAFLSEGPRRLPEIKQEFDLPPSMAANLVIQLEDAGLIEEAGAGTACSSCHSQACTGCGEKSTCPVNPPYRLTEAGKAFLKKANR